ncbi:hypothetical protein [uncultured Duncaniella sp.]|uniref:hypothetical protein n=1 Tax=uncultured Duncaniella sp. TaxID=2768039 RepID=UPI00272B9EB1|nr:hypothetical protein [uncultured Duncaniella sp.]
MNNEDNVQQGVDDGSLAFLRIPRDENSRSLIGDEIKQSKIVNTSFWVFKFLEDIPTRFSKQKGTAGQTLVQIRPSKDSPESESQKFFTGSAEILYVLKEIQKRDAFPRKVTLRSNGNRFYFE